MRDRRSSIANLRSLNSEMRASTVRRSRCASVLAFWSTAMICTLISLARTLARAMLAADLAALSQYPRPITVRRIDPRVLDDLLLEQMVQLVALGANQFDLLLLGGAPRFHSLDLLQGLVDAELELLFLTVPAQLVARKQAAFSVDHDVRGARHPPEIGRKFDRGKVVAFRNQSRLAAQGLAQLRAHDKELRLDLDVVQRRQNLAFLDEIALPDRKRFHDAAIPVLNLLQVLVDLHDTGGDDSAFEPRDRRPSAAADHQQNHQRQTTQHPWPQPEGPFRGASGGRMAMRSEANSFEL